MPKYVRFLLEVTAIVAVAVGVGLAHLGQSARFTAVAGVWGAVAFLEVWIRRR
jgi:hypothetical protein